MRKAAILGLGRRGRFWLKTALEAGWQVSGFDPDPAASPTSRRSDWQREHTISGTVKKADWIVCCLPERLELMQKVIQRAQAEVPEAAVIAVDTLFDIEDVQNCSTRPGQLVRILRENDDCFALSVTSRNLPEFRNSATLTLAEFAAALNVQLPSDEQSSSQANAETA